MNSANKTKRVKNRILYTLIVAMLLFSLFLLMINYSYRNARKNGFENLHIQTKEIKEDIELQIASDAENLQTMARFAAKLYADGEGFDLLLNSFKAIGLIEDIGILNERNVFVTRAGAMKAPAELSFEEEAKKVPYVSGEVEDITVKGHKIVRSAVPIKVDEKTVGILYGIIDLETLEKRIMENASVQSTQIFVVERGTGNFIVSTISGGEGNISVLRTRKFISGYSYEEIKNSVLAGKDGYTAFVSQIMKGTTLYLHHSPLAISDWHIMMAEPEENVFAEARDMSSVLVVMFVAIVSIMLLYLWLIFSAERREGKLHLCASKIRKLLLGINQQTESINEALENITRFSMSRSSFFVDTDGEDYNYIVPDKKNKILAGDDRAYFVSRILNYAVKTIKKRGTTASIIKLSAQSQLAYEEPEFFAFMKKHGIKTVIFSGISNRKNHVSILGIVNPGNTSGAQILLEDISICFSMAIYNKKYLNKTETIAATDSLTELSNRMAYKKDLAKFDEKNSENFSCVYVDVNELHVINNKYGHAAGDGMLLFIANALKECFPGSHIYRIGGDEFLVFTEGKDKESIEKSISELITKVEEMNYYISVGMDFCVRNVDTESLVAQAEKRMYEEKAKYYQKKEKRVLEEVADQNVQLVATGNKEIDTLLSVMSRRYHGVYCVSLKTGMARKILMPSYLSQFSEEKDSFKDAFNYYVREMARAEYQRPLLSFLNYDAIRRQLLEGTTPAIEYSKVNGENVVLSVYPLPGQEDDIQETLWVFENID